MSQATTLTPRAIAAQLSPTAAFFLFASIAASFLAGSSAPTPLYPTYMAEWGLSPITITAIFGIYALAVLTALLFAGRLSDHLGRKPVLLVATVAQALTMVLFATATSVSGLLIARIVQGLTTGAALGAVGAAMIDLDRNRGTIANAVAAPFGTALGGLLAGALVAYLPFPTMLVYTVLAAVFVLQAIGLAYTADPIEPRGNVLASLKPQITLPRATREPLLLALPVLIAVWALAGFCLSLGPLVLRGMTGSTSPLLSGLAPFVLASSGGISVLFLHKREPHQMMTLGGAGLLVGAVLALVAVLDNAVTLFFLAMAVAGVGFGAGFQGAIRTVLPHAAAHERAGVLSIIFIISYISMGAPAVIAGWMIARHGGVAATAEIFCATLIALSGAALLGSLLWRFTKKTWARSQAGL